MSSNDTGDDSKRPRDEEKNPFVSFKRHVDQQFATLLGSFRPVDSTRRAQQRCSDQWRERREEGDTSKAWEQAMKDFEDSEKEAKEWYDKVLRQITSRRDEHLESGLGFGGEPVRTTDAEEPTRPYVMPENDRMEMLPKLNATETKTAGKGDSTDLGQPSRQYPHSKFLDWVWTGWGGQSTTPNMLWHQGPRQENDPRVVRSCRWSKSVPAETYSDDTLESPASAPAWPMPGEMAAEAVSNPSREQKYEDIYGQNGLRGVINEMLRDAPLSADQQRNSEELNRKLAIFEEFVDKFMGKNSLFDLAEEIKPAIKRLSSNFDHMGTSPNPAQPNDCDENQTGPSTRQQCHIRLMQLEQQQKERLSRARQEQENSLGRLGLQDASFFGSSLQNGRNSRATELDQFEEVFKHNNFGRSPFVKEWPAVPQEESARSMIEPCSEAFSKMRSQSLEDHAYEFGNTRWSSETVETRPDGYTRTVQSSEDQTDEFGNTYRSSRTVETLPDGRAKRIQKMAYFDRHFNLLGDYSTEELVDEDDAWEIVGRNQFPKNSHGDAATQTFAPLRGNFSPSTSAEVKKLVEAKKQEQKVGGGWFWKS